MLTYVSVSPGTCSSTDRDVLLCGAFDLELGHTLHFPDVLEPSSRPVPCAENTAELDSGEQIYVSVVAQTSCCS